MDTILKKATAYLKRHVDIAVSQLGRLRFSKEHPQHFTAICLHTRTIHLAAGTWAAAMERATPCLPMMIRAMWEADIDLDNTIADPEYAKNMYAYFLKEKLRLSDAAQPSKSNRFLNHLPNAIDLPHVTAATRAELDKLIAAGRGPLSIKARATNVNRLDEYESIYNLMSLDAHNNIRSLEVDHVEHRPDGSYQLTLYSTQMTIEAIKDVLIATGIMASSIDKTASLLSIGQANNLSILQAWTADRAPIEEAVMEFEKTFLANNGLVGTGDPQTVRQPPQP